MYPNLMDLYGSLQSMSKESADQVTAQSAKVSSLVQECYQVWLGVMTESLGATTKAVQDLAVCKSPMEAAEVQRAYIEAMSARSMAHAQKLMSLTQTMVGSMAIPMLQLPGTAAVGEPPKAKPVAAAPAPSPAPAASAPVASAPARSVPAAAPAPTAPVSVKPAPAVAPVVGGGAAPVGAD